MGDDRNKREVSALAFMRDARVIYQIFGVSKHGTVVKRTTMSAWVHFDGTAAEDAERIPLDKLRLETQEDVARRTHRDSLVAWRSRRPVLRRMTVETNAWGAETSVALFRANTPEVMREAARELQELADWFEQRPAKL